MWVVGRNADLKTFIDKTNGSIEQLKKLITSVIETLKHSCSTLGLQENRWRTVPKELLKQLTNVEYRMCIVQAFCCSWLCERTRKLR